MSNKEQYSSPPCQEIILPNLNNPSTPPRKRISMPNNETLRPNTARRSPLVGADEISIDVLADEVAENIAERKEKKNNMSKFEQENYWKSCCGSIVDRRTLTYVVQVIASFGAIIFCMAKIWNADQQECTGEDITIWVSLLSTIIGAYIPTAPLVNSKR